MISGGDDKLLKIFDYETLIINQIVHFELIICSSRFTYDSTILYVGDNNG